MKKQDLLYGQSVGIKAQNLFITSKLPEILLSLSKTSPIDVFFIAAIMDKFRIDYVFKRTELTGSHIKTIKKLIKLLENIRDGGRDLTEIYEIIRNNNELHLNVFFSKIFEITHSEEFATKSFENYTLYDPELYNEAISSLNSLEAGDAIDPFHGRIKRSERIAKMREEKQHDFREFLFFLKFYLVGFKNITVGSRSIYRKLGINDIYFLLILCSPFLEEFYKKRGMYGENFENYYVPKRMPGITKLSDICPAFEILYEYYRPFYKKRGNKRRIAIPKVLSNFLDSYLNLNPLQKRFYEEIETKIEEEYKAFKDDYDINQLYYITEILKEISPIPEIVKEHLQNILLKKIKTIEIKSFKPFNHSIENYISPKVKYLLKSFNKFSFDKVIKKFHDIDLYLKGENEKVRNSNQSAVVYLKEEEKAINDWIKGGNSPKTDTNVL